VSAAVNHQAAVLARTDPFTEDVLRPILESGKRYWIALGLCLAAMAWAMYCWAYQILVGQGVTGNSQTVMWSLYETNFVFWVGISHAGTLISAILRVTGASWRRPITRAAEAITVFALMIGPMFVLIHLGRVWLFYWVIPFPNLRDLWPNFRSPLLWDFTCINSYLLGSITYLYLPMIPDLAAVRDAAGHRLAPWRRKLYRLLALGWQGTPKQWALLERAISVMAVIIMPLAVSVHTVVSWVFAMTVQPMWHSTIFGPYFVVGAIFSGVAAVLLALYVIRRLLRLEAYLREEHFRNLGLLLLTFCLLWGYFTFAEHLTTWYGRMTPEWHVLQGKLSGPMAPFFWTMLACCLPIPLALLIFKRTPGGTALASLSVVVGMWLERFVIVLGTMTRPRLTFNWQSYMPTWVELSITLGAFAYFLFLYLAFAKLFPIISIWEYKEGLREGHRAV
jgi:molybdopterin-containing oxidoreductase family membrane subunit